jgi:hypothetical protein
MPQSAINRYNKIKQALIDEGFGDMAAILAEIERQAYDEIVSTGETRLLIDGNRIKFSAGNLSKVQLFIKIVGRYSKIVAEKVGGLFRKTGIRILNENENYYKEITKPGFDRWAEARRMALLQWGYNSETEEVVAGGYLDQVFAGQTAISQRVAKLINQAVARKLPLQKFRDLFRGVFLAGKSSIYQSYFTRATYDLYQRLDRASNFIYAQQLGLRDAIYTGTVMDTTRAWCEKHVGKVFSFKEIETWRTAKWGGKNDPYDPFLDCGGYNCRHHWSFITPEMASILRKRK